MRGSTAVQPTWDNPEKVGFEYGGTAVADMDGDGRPDIVFGRHGGGPAIAYNLETFVQIRMSSKAVEFDRMVAEKGLKAALEARDRAFEQ